MLNLSLMNNITHATIITRISTLSQQRSIHPTKLHSSYCIASSSSSTAASFISNSLQYDEQKCNNVLPLCPPLSQSVAAIVFGDGSKESSKRLYPLTKRRSEGAIPIAANYRLIDAVISNCINSNISKIYALTQFNSTSLNSHLSRAYSGAGLVGKQGFDVEVIAAYQSREDQGWFQGTADAVRRCLWVLEDDHNSALEFILLPGHHLYKMDYQNLLATHRSSNADITLAVAPPAHHIKPNNGHSSFGYVTVNSENEVLEFREKQESEKPNPTAVQSYIFGGYWEDMTNIKAFYKASMESTKNSTSGYNFYDRESTLYTLPKCLPPSLIMDAIITDSIIGGGCILNSCNIRGSVIGTRTRIGDRTVIEDSVLMGADIYQQTTYGDQCIGEEGTGIGIPIGIGENSYIRKAIIDKNVRIGKNIRITNKDNVQEGNREALGYIISGGIVIVLRNTVIPDGSIL
ncbi:inactive glucose-1-phosphate adenylyltransferase small subunit 2, chloroplastic-like isoform X2 [Papaver somniferum]|uniref:inactive glucose-1-phosphate adenylyltransferase small subunit 2, chloroplastic-like isoform X2 n=1 Tax=Papaver somniferum TaxID=3469 RepID=UPI000E6FA9C3|nr:inactive glucose-1-phosphate adenylyltransferase small subunit 2, chloroplastic-like isoform X2 [Papaver somniferum]